jgi:thiol-disulfide isomerase/thioredoxin
MKQVVLFGKTGCGKCKVLKGRVEKLLEKDDYKDFSLVYHDILNENSLVEFCKVEELNPQRIPAVVIYKDSMPQVHYLKLALPEACGDIQLNAKLGVQTDYDTGNGTITPEVVMHLLEFAK